MSKTLETTTATIISCARCTNRWTGLNTAHCGACHQTFTGPTAFDKHRDGSHSQGTRHCLHPETIGLVDAGRGYPCWGWPGNYNPRNGNLSDKTTTPALSPQNA